jgi:hypothetical protein
MTQKLPILYQRVIKYSTSNKINMAKVKIVKAPAMEYGGRLPYAGRNANSVNRVNPIANQMVDTRWRYFSPADVYSYKKDDYATKRSLPESEDPDIIVEKQEQVIADFDGDGKQELMGVNTGSHASGDDQGINVPDGGFVYSDTKELTIDQPYGMMSSGTDAEEYKKGGKVKGTKKRVREQLLYGYKDFGATGPATPAQLAKKYDLQKMSAIIDDPKKDNLAKKTANLMYENYMNKLTQLADTQEAMKAAKKAKEQRAQMEMGGFAPEMQGGGPRARVDSRNMVAGPKPQVAPGVYLADPVPFRIGDRERAEAERLAQMQAADAQRKANMRYIMGADPYSVPMDQGTIPATVLTNPSQPLRNYGIVPSGYTIPASAPAPATSTATTATTTGTGTSTGTTGKKKVMITGSPATSQSQNIYGFRFDQDPNQTPVPDIPGVYQPKWRFDKDQTHAWSPVETIIPGQESSPYESQEVDMTGLGAYDPVIPRGSTRLNKFLVGARDTAKDIGKALSNPDLLGDIAMGLESLGIKKYKPWEPPVVSVMPQASYLSADRELAYNSEMAAMAGLIGNQIGNTRTAAAIGRGAQGQALSNAANILGKTYNANVGIKNQFETLANNLTNETLEKQRERAGRLNYDTFMANQMYRNQINDALDATVKRAYEKENEARNRAVANLNNKYWHYDKRNFPVWNYEGAREEMLKEMERTQMGLPSEKGTVMTLPKLKQAYMDTYDLSEEDAQKLALSRIRKMTNAPADYDSRDESSTSTKTNTKKKTAKTGGFSPKSISKFLAHSLG